MYIPKLFAQQDQAALEALIRNHPLATVVVNTQAGLSANHIPLRLTRSASSQLILQGHLAKANPMRKERLSDDVLAIFHGADAYISPNWYQTKQEHGKVVPTWNYVTVHASGTIRYIDDDDWKLDFLHHLTDEQEASQGKPWSINDAPSDYTEKMLGAISGFEIEVVDLKGKWKASQNQPECNLQGVVEGLSASPDGRAREFAELMQSGSPKKS
ncbi:MAG: FMN-binding negative transcriptional regulator [Gammaproteobacteria bacterium]|nr:FMN-binding negative transcriptional regulator [Gammaproteobacteria bacterium]